MKNAFLAFFLAVFVLCACSPATGPAAREPNTSAATNQPGVLAASPTVASAPALRPADLTATPDPGGKSKKQVTPQPTAKKPAVESTRVKNKKTAPPLAASGDLEIMGRPTDNSVTFNLISAAGGQVYYEYGTQAGQYGVRTSPQEVEPGIPVEITLEGLQANTRYYCRLHGASDAGPEHTFITQRGAGSSFTFDIQGDSHPERDGKQFDAALYTRTLLGAAADAPDFYIAMGDDFSVDTLQTVNAQTVRDVYLRQREWLGLPGAPVFLVNGNHEQASLANLDGTANNVSVWAQTSRNSLYPQPAPDNFYTGDSQAVEHIGLLRDYYAFTWGDALFVVIDPYWHSPQTVDNQFGADRDEKKNRDLWNVTLGEAQYRWFRQTLEQSTAKYKFVFSHHVLGTGRGGVELAGGYEWGDAANLAAHRPGWDKTIQQVMADTKVTVFFQGHDHIFARQELDGVTYQTLPEPANPFYTYENSDAFTSGDKQPNSGRVRVSVASDSVQVEYVRSYLDQPDEVAFRYTLK
jgi:hypothetical protein